MTRRLLLMMLLTDLASTSLGSNIAYVTDEFFAAAINMLNPAPPIHAPGRFIGIIFSKHTLFMLYLSIYRYWSLDGRLGIKTA